MAKEATDVTDGRTGMRPVPLRLDLSTRELRHGDERVALRAQPFEILRLLLDRPGEVVERTELCQHLWPEGTFVDFEHSLNAAVKRLRAAIGDTPRNPRFIETVPRRGYRWIHRFALRPLRLAVFPLTTNQQEVEFREGLMDELCAELGRRGAGRLSLTRRSSSRCLDATQRACDQTSSGPVDFVLEGSVRRYDGRVRISVWLVDARRDIQTWSEIYERVDGDPVPTQVEIAALVSAAVIEQLTFGANVVAPSPAEST